MRHSYSLLGPPGPAHHGRATRTPRRRPPWSLALKRPLLSRFPPQVGERHAGGLRVPAVPVAALARGQGNEHLGGMNSRDRNPMQFVACHLLHGALRLARLRGEPGSRLSGDLQAFEVFEWKHDGRLGSMARARSTRGGSVMRRTIRADVVLDDDAAFVPKGRIASCVFTRPEVYAMPYIEVNHAIRLSWENFTYGD